MTRPSRSDLPSTVLRQSLSRSGSRSSQGAPSPVSRLADDLRQCAGVSASEYLLRSRVLRNLLSPVAYLRQLKSRVIARRRFIAPVSSVVRQGLAVRLPGARAFQSVASQPLRTVSTSLPESWRVTAANGIVGELRPPRLQ